MPRTVPYILMYRPVPVTGSVWVPPVPVVVEKMVVQVVASGDTWIWKALGEHAGATAMDRT